jgi:predicted metalloprotease
VPAESPTALESVSVLSAGAAWATTGVRVAAAAMANALAAIQILLVVVVMVLIPSDIFTLLRSFQARLCHGQPTLST